MEKIILILFLLLSGCVVKQYTVTYEYKEVFWLREYNNMLFLNVTLNGLPAKLLIDTGASKSLLDITKAKEYEFGYLAISTEQYVGLGGSTDIHVVYDYEIEEFFTPFLGADLSEITDRFLKNGIFVVGILGADFLDIHNVVIDFRKNLMYKKR